MYTSVENQFITRFLPQANGDAVRVYLYGLYLCQCADEFDAESMAKILRLTPQNVQEAFDFWEECDLVQVLSRNPLFVQYLPVTGAIGKPKAIRPEKYAQFNRALYQLLQKAKKDLKPYEMQRILEFLEREPMEHEAFLLVVEYCIKKDGEKFTLSHVMNKGEKLCREHKYTYESVEREFYDFHEFDKELAHIFSLLGIKRKATEDDYDFLKKWQSWGMELKAVYACAQALKKGSLYTLDDLVNELRERSIFTQTNALEYLAHREESIATVYLVAKRLGIKVENPRPFAEQYVEKWLERGYEGKSLALIAALCLDLRYGFGELDALLDKLYQEGIVDEGSVSEYCSARNRQIKLLQDVQSVCGVQKKTQATFDMLAAWKLWNFSDQMILEAAKRSVNASNPIAYINKLLAEWKRLNIFDVKNIPEKATTTVAPKDYRSEAAIALDKRSERERYYATLHEKAVTKAEKMQKRAEQNEEFCSAELAIKESEIQLAKAEVFAPDTLPALRLQLEQAKTLRSSILAKMNLSESDLLPKFVCNKCSDSGFLPNGRACDCYKG